MIAAVLFNHDRIARGHRSSLSSSSSIERSWLAGHQ
jgi:hypothetical protein